MKPLSNLQEMQVHGLDTLEISTAEEVKYLGVNFGQKLSWNTSKWP